MFKYPIQVDIDITEKCNFECKYCTASERKDFTNEMTIVEFENLIYNLYNWGVMNFNIAGGEPLIKKGIYNFLENISQLKGIDLTLVTNGSLITSDLVSFKKAHPELHLIVSLDSVFKSINDLSRDQTETVLENMKTLIEQGIKFSVAQVITMFNIDSFFENVQILREMSIDQILVIKYIAAGGGRDSKDECEIPYDVWKKFLSKLTEMKKNGGFSKYAVSVACPWELYLPLLSDGYDIDDIYHIWNYKSPLLLDGYKQSRELGCHAGITNLNILANGDVYPCSIAGNNKKLLCGNVKEQNIEDIWKSSPVLMKLRKMRLNQISGKCTTCDIANICGGGCRIRAFYGTSSLYGEDYLCPNLIN